MEKPTRPESVDRLRAAIERADAPAALRLDVAQQVTRARERCARGRRISVGASVIAAAATAAVLVLPGHPQPSVEQIVRVAAAASRAPAPPLDRADPRRLAAHVDGVWFPSWRGLRWRAVGRSSRTVAGRSAVTVYYRRDDGARIAYTIVAGRTLPWPDHTRAVTRGWMRLHVYSDRAQRVITWRKSGHQCVIAAPRSLPAATLLALASDEAA